MGVKRVMRGSGQGALAAIGVAPLLLAIGVALGTGIGVAKHLIGDNPLLVIGGAAYVAGLVYIARRRAL